MKRRNVDCVKPRRLLKRTKIGEGFYGSSFIYVKFLVVWLLVIAADYLFEFRFEYLWPFWLLLRSVYDSFRYQGLAFSVLFICMALTSDMICILFIPVHWLFFAASTYVWVQFVWHSEKGICMPSVALWVLFIYIEGLIRLKDIKNPPFHLDLCRPFAAHCIGYPVVTLGFGLKSYVGYRLRQRKQREVSKENEFYFQVLREALPVELQASLNDKAHKEKPEDVLNLSKDSEVHSNHHHHSGGSRAVSSCNGSISHSSHSNSNHSNNHVTSGGTSRSRGSKGLGDHYHHKEDVSPPPVKVANKVPNGSIHIELEYMQKKGWPSPKSINDFDESEAEKDKNVKSLPPNSHQGGSSPTQNSVGDSNHKRSNSSSSTSTVQSNGSAKFAGTHPNNLKEGSIGGPTSPRDQKKSKNNKENNKEVTKDDSVTIVRLEADVKRLKVDLQNARQTEQDLKNQVNTLLSNEKLARQENNQLQQDNDTLQTKLHNLVTARQNDRATISSQEKKFQEEKKTRQSADHQVSQLERKIKKLEDQNKEKAQALATAKSECSESCRNRRDDTELEVKRLRRENRSNEERARVLERENLTLRQYKESQGEAEVLMSALSAMQEKTSQLESSLSAETKIKLDLFSALGEAKRQLSIAQNQISTKEKEIEELKTKFTEVLAVYSPASTFPTNNSADSSTRFYSSKLLPPSTKVNTSLDCSSPMTLGESILGDSGTHESLNLGLFNNQRPILPSPISPPTPKNATPLSNLDPNARVYTPKSAPDHES